MVNKFRFHHIAQAAFNPQLLFFRQDPSHGSVKRRSRKAGIRSLEGLDISASCLPRQITLICPNVAEAEHW